MAVQRRHEVPRRRGPMRDGVLREGFGLGWSELWSNFMRWARQSQHPQKRAAGTAPSHNRGVSPRMREAALQGSPYRCQHTSTLTTRSSDVRGCESQYAFFLLGCRRAEQSLNPWHSPSRVSAKFRTRSLPPECRSDVLADATGSEIQCGSRKCLWSIDFRC